MITNAGLSRILNILSTELSHIGVGTGTPPTQTSTLLTNEVLRKQVTSPLIDGTTIVSEIYLDETEGNDTNFTEVGIFCDGATTELNTGTLFAGGGMDVTKNNTQSLTISFEITVLEV